MTFKFFPFRSLKEYTKYICNNPHTLLPRILGIWKDVKIYNIDGDIDINSSSCIIVEKMILNASNARLIKTIGLKGSKSKNRHALNHSISLDDREKDPPNQTIQRMQRNKSMHKLKSKLKQDFY